MITTKLRKFGEKPSCFVKTTQQQPNNNKTPNTAEVDKACLYWRQSTFVISFKSKNVSFLGLYFLCHSIRKSIVCLLLQTKSLCKPSECPTTEGGTLTLKCSFKQQKMGTEIVVEKETGHGLNLWNQNPRSLCSF